MKLLLLGKGVANDGCKKLLEKEAISFDYLNIKEVADYDYDYIVKSPGISLEDPIFKKLKGKIISDIELCYILKHPYIIGVTGSNGKTTVVSMLSYILGNKYKVIACGNIGYSVCDAVADYENADIFIVELSSFQLEATQSLDCNISVILNISPCHLDHHKTMRNYVNSKLNIAINQSASHYVVYNMDNPYLKNVNKESMASPIGFSYKSTISRIYVLNDYIYFKNKRIYKLSKEDLSCKHIVENYLAVLSVISIMNFNMKKACRLLKKFKSVPYRMTRLDSYTINDAKSTNCAATNAAIHSLNQIHLICGGYDRGMEIHLDKECISKLVMVYAYGQTKNKIHNYFFKKDIPCNLYDTLEEAYRDADQKRKEKEVILFSPMFASFDQYKSYEERGKEFDSLYLKLKRHK